jgi:hypothetical protein
MAADISNGSLYLFGGNDDESHFNDLWRYQNGGWTDLTPGGGTKPTARTLTALTFDPVNQRLLLFGGRNASGSQLADLWAFNLGSSSWSQLDPGGGGGDPPARHAHSLTFDWNAGNAVLVGGVSSNGQTFLSETWYYETGGWTQATPPTSPPPTAYHQAVYGNGVIWLVAEGGVWVYE